MAEFEGKEGKWITTKTGVHVFIPNDKSVQEVMAEQFDEFEWDDEEDDWSREGVRKRYYEFFVPEITDEAERNHKDKVIKSFRGLLDSPMAYIRNGFKRAILKHPVYDMPLENCIADMMMAKTNVQYMYVRDIWSRGEDTFYNRITRRLNMKYDGDSYTTLSNYYHESGHALDRDPTTGDYSSFTVKGEDGKTISELLVEEVTPDKYDYIVKQIESMTQVKEDAYNRYKAGEISFSKYREYNRPYWNIRSSLGDVIHAASGDYDKAVVLTGAGGHPRGYFKDYKSERTGKIYPEGSRKRGSEFFAEMVDDLITDKHRTFSNMMEHIAPKACKLFYQIMKEKYGYERQ